MRILEPTGMPSSKFKHVNGPVAVLTNGSLLWVPDVQEALAVKVMSDSPPPTVLSARLPAVTDEDILDLLARRPCTAQGVAAGLNLHFQEAAKRLYALTKTGDVFFRERAVTFSTGSETRLQIQESQHPKE